MDSVKNTIGPYLKDKWLSLGDHPIVGEARIKGLMGAIELTNDKVKRSRFPSDFKVGSLCRDISIKNGLVMRAVGDSMIIAPPLVINHEQIDELVDKARTTLDETQEAVQKL